MKARSLFLLLLATCLLTTTSCINLLEKIFFRNDGSGTYTFTVDMSQVKDLMEMAGDEMDSDQMMKDLSLDKTAIDKTLLAVEGVSQVKYNFDSVDFQMILSFDFMNLDALNNGLNAYFRDSTKLDAPHYIFFERKGNNLNRSKVNLLVDNFNEGMKEQMGGGETDMEMAQMLMGDMFFSSEIQFEGEIKSFSNDEYEKRGNNSILWKKYLFKSSDTKSDISVKIKTK